VQGVVHRDQANDVKEELRATKQNLINLVDEIASNLADKDSRMKKINPDKPTDPVTPSTTIAPN
jgi:hypothetical protein